MIFFAGFVTGGTVVVLWALCLAKKWAKECPKKLDEALEWMKNNEL